MPTFDHARLGEIIDSFYEAAVRPELWRSILHQMSMIVGAEGALLLGHPISTVGAIWSEGVDETVDFGARNGWYARNARLMRGVPVLAEAPGQFVTESTLFSREELDRLPFNAEFVNRMGFRWFAGGILSADNGHLIALSIERRTRKEPFSTAELAMLRSILPHMQRAGRLSLNLALARASGMLDAFEQMGCGALLLDLAGRVVRANAKAEGLFDESLGLAQGKLVAKDRASNAELQRLATNVIAPLPAHAVAACGAVRLQRAKGSPLVVYAAPIVGSAGDIFQQAKAIMMLIDPDSEHAASQEILVQAFGLTRAEGRLAALVGAGKSPREAAAKLGITEETARTALKRVFAKVGVSRQSELVALLSKLTLNYG